MVKNFIVGFFKKCISIMTGNMVFMATYVFSSAKYLLIINETHSLRMQSFDYKLSKGEESTYDFFININII